MHQVSHQASLEHVGVEEHKEDHYGGEDQADVLNSVIKVRKTVSALKVALTHRPSQILKHKFKTETFQNVRM